MTEKTNKGAFNTGCAKCKAPMPPPAPLIKSGPFSGLVMSITAYACKCGHWNNLKTRKGYAEYKAQRERKD